MKYLIITNHSHMLWQFRRELIAELIKDGEVVISTPFAGHEDDFADMGCRMIETQLDRRSIDPMEEARLVRFYIRLLKKERPDVAVTYSIKPNIYAGFACRMLGIPYCVNVQGLGTMFQNERSALVAGTLYREALKGAHTVFFENAENAHEFLRRRILRKDRITLLHGAGVNLNYHQMQAYPPEDDGVHFLYLGRLMKEKGVEELFTAAEAVKAKYGEAVHFDLVGFFDDDMKDRVEELAAQGIVSFHGFQEDPRPWYGRAHCVVLPSWHEGMSNVLLEAAATGRALITTDIPGCREAVLPGKSGFLCKKQDPESLIEAMEEFLARTGEERRQMGVQGRKRMERNFDRRAVIEKTVRCIRGAVR